MEFLNLKEKKSREPLFTLQRSIFQSSLEKVDVALTKGDLEGALQWASLGTWCAVTRGPFGELVSIGLEEKLLRIAAQIPVPIWRHNRSGKRRILHVFSKAYSIFGHSKLCRKWIEMDSHRTLHNVILLSQDLQVPRNLREVVERQGGTIIRLDPAAPLLKRAQELRKAAYEHADLVILHVHPEDVIPGVAFGVAGGPPVMYVNHADHMFWVGRMISDLVLDIRDSGHTWTRTYRGIQRARILPIPLGENVDILEKQAEYASIRLKTRRALGIPKNDIVFLTVGDAYKYRPSGGLSFIKAACAILEECPHSWVLAIGPSLEGEWELVSKRVGSRLLALGIQKELAPFHYAADVYLEGMPFGSLTALLEAGLVGLPCVRAPAQVEPPYASDGIAFADNPQPKDVDSYVREAILLAGDANERFRRGERLRERIRGAHCGQAWRNILDQIKSDMPEVHATYTDSGAVPLSARAQQFWLNFVHKENAAAVPWFLGDVLHEAVRRCSDVRHSLMGILLKDSKVPLQQAGWEKWVLPLIFPNLNATGGGAPWELAEPYFLVSRALADLVTTSPGEGRTNGSRLLAARMCCQRPSLLKQRDFAKAFLKVWLGPTAVHFIRKVRSLSARVYPKLCRISSRTD